MDCPSTPGAPWFPFTLIQASQTSCLLIWNGLPDAFSSSPQLLLEHFWLTERTTATDDPAPSLRPHYRGFITTTGRSASAPRRRYSCPHGALPAPPGTHTVAPVLMSSERVTTLQQWSSSRSPPDASRAPFPHRSPRRSSANAA